MHLAGDLSDACKLVARVKALMDFAIQLPTTTKYTKLLLSDPYWTARLPEGVSSKYTLFADATRPRRRSGGKGAADDPQCQLQATQRSSATGMHRPCGALPQ